MKVKRAATKTPRPKSIHVEIDAKSGNVINDYLAQR